MVVFCCAPEEFSIKNLIDNFVLSCISILYWGGRRMVLWLERQIKTPRLDSQLPKENHNASGWDRLPLLGDLHASWAGDGAPQKNWRAYYPQEIISMAVVRTFFWQVSLT